VVVERGLLAAGRYLKLRIEMDDRPGALAKLATDLADVKANIHDIVHDRRTKGLVMGTTAVRLLLETRGNDHAAEIVKSLKKGGYALRIEGEQDED
jgi:threonine dehydratase